MPKLKPLNGKTGTNLQFFDKEDHFLIKVSKNAAVKKSSTGRSDILASSDGWISLSDLSGDSLENKEVGINISVTMRDKKSKAKASKKDA